MRKYGWIPVIVVMAACGATAVPPVVAPAPSTQLEIVGRQLAGGLRVSYRLPRPVASFPFLVAGGPIRAESWHLLTPELELVGDAVKPVRPGTFDRFEVLITPDQREHDRVYPAMFAMGPRAFVVNTRYLLADGGAPASIELDAAAGNQVVSSFAPAGRVVRFEASSAEEKGHYVYVGDQAPPTAGAAAFIVAPSVPAWLRDRLQGIVARGVPLYADKLGRPLAARPFVVVAYTDVDDARRSYRGDTVAHGEIALRFRGRGWDASEDDDATESLFLLHELVHLWNAELSHPPHDGHLAWLHEGSAEYLALRAARQLDVLTDAQLDAHIGDAVNGCIDALGAGSLLDANKPVQRGFYTCGVVVQWLAELSVKPRADSFAIWKTLVAQPAYSVDGFRVEVSDRSRGSTLLDFVLGATRDWSQLPKLVAPSGVTLAPATGARWDAKRRAHLMSHLLAESCTGPHGFYSFDDHLKLDTGKRCGVLSNDPDVSFLDGHDLYTDLDAAYRAVADKCARSLAVGVRDRNGHATIAQCAHPLPDLPPWFALVP